MISAVLGAKAANCKSAYFQKNLFSLRRKDANQHKKVKLNVTTRQVVPERHTALDIAVRRGRCEETSVNNPHHGGKGGGAHPARRLGVHPTPPRRRWSRQDVGRSDFERITSFDLNTQSSAPRNERIRHVTDKETRMK